MTMQGTDSSQNNVGPPATVTYNFSVLPQPVFAPVAPTTFPSIPGMSNYWAYLASYGQTQSQCGSDCYGVQSVVQMLNAELNPPGWYFGGDNFSSGLTVGPLGIWNYDGTRVAYGVGTVLGTVPRWQSLHSYPQWSAVTDGNNVEVNTSACTSSSSRCPTAMNAVCAPSLERDYRQQDYRRQLHLGQRGQRQYMEPGGGAHLRSGFRLAALA